MSSPRSAIIYARISKDEGQTFAGVQRQVTNARAWIDKQPDVQLNVQLDGTVDRKHPERPPWGPGVFVDDDLSATRHKRPEYNRAMRYATGGDAELIVASEQDRVWRDMEEAAGGLKKLEEHDVKLVFLDTGEVLDLSDEGTKMRVGMMAVVASWFSGNIAAKQRKATREAAEVGAYHGARPFGYSLMHYNVQPSLLGQERTDFSVHVPVTGARGERVMCPGCNGFASNKVRTIVPQEPEAGAVQEAFELVSGGVSPYAVCQYLDGQEIMGPDGERISRPAIRTAQGKTWEQVGEQALTNILSAKRYTGIRKWDPKQDGGKQARRDIKGNWPALVDDLLFDAVQGELKRRYRARPAPNTPSHLATGYTFGGFCGHKICSHTINGKRRYCCITWSSEGKCVNFEADVVDREIKLYMFKWLAANTFLTKQLEHTGNAEVQELYRQRKNREEQLNDLDDDWDDGRFTKSDGTRDRAKFDERRARKQKQIDELDGKIDVARAGGKSVSRGSAFPTGRAFRAWWAGADMKPQPPDAGALLARRRDCISQFIDKVLIYPAGAGNKPDPRLIRIHPGDWAKGSRGAAAQPHPPPDPVSFTSKGQILAFLREHPGEWFTREAISAETGVSQSATHKVLTTLGAGGEVSREWRKRGGQRACYVFSSVSGESWGPRTRNAPGGAIGSRETIKAFLESRPTEWFSVAEIGEGSGGKYGAPHVTRTVNQLVDAGFAQRRPAPLPHKHVRWQYSINGR